MRTIRNLMMSIAAVCAAACGGAFDDDDAAPDLVMVQADPSDRHIAHLPAFWRERFVAGDVGFSHAFRPSEGLGPVYIRTSCAACHTDDGKGPGFVMKMAVRAEGWDRDPAHFPFGITERPQSVGNVRPVTAPDLPGLHMSLRVGPAVYARGYMEAIADEAILAEARSQSLRTDGIHGRVNWVDRVSRENPRTLFHGHVPGGGPYIGRFGVKGRLASVDDFVADAYQGDMGITSPLRPHELDNPDHATGDGCDLDLESVNLVSDYVRLVALPKRVLPKGAGAALFDRVQCAACHVPSMRTRADYPVPNLADIDAPVFTDMLLHHMGDDLADGVFEFDAGGEDWRTAPLVGLRFMQGYLHDSRARTLRDAVLMHAGPGSEANGSVGAFNALSASEQRELLDYVSAL